MARPTYEEVLKLAEALPREERLQLIAALATQARDAAAPHESRPRWRDIRGTVPYPAFGEDAQAWVSRTRDEWEERERQWRENR